MPFKIVQTIEDGKICLSVVPSNWEINGILCWPPTPMSNVSSKEHSKPKSSWLKYSCVVKRVFTKYESAVQEQKKMEMQTDTEDEEAVESLLNAQENLPPPTIQHSYAVNKNKPQYDFNEYLILPPSNQLVNKLPPPPPIPASIEDSSIGQNISLSDVHLESPFLITSQNDNASILQNQKKIIELLESQKENTSKILSQLAKHEIIFEELYKKIGKIEQNHSSFIPSNSQNINVLFERFPAVKSIKELQELEEKLKEPTFRKRYIDCMSVLCSEGSSLRGNNLCYKMIDFFMARDIFLECSWTGNTRDDLRTEKKPFKFFENVRATFLTVIRTTDPNFGQLQCDDFFKRIIKNSKQRFEAATKPINTSTPKRNSRKRARIEPVPEDMEIEQTIEEMKTGCSRENRESAIESQEKWEARQCLEDREAGQHQESTEFRQRQENIKVGHMQEEREARQYQKGTENKQYQDERENRQPQKNKEIQPHQEDSESRQESSMGREYHKGREDGQRQEDRNAGLCPNGREALQRQEDKAVKQPQKSWEIRRHRENIVVGYAQENMSSEDEQRKHCHKSREDIQEDRDAGQYLKGREVRQSQEDIDDEQQQEDRKAKQYQEYSESTMHQENRVKHPQENSDG